MPGGAVLIGGGAKAVVLRLEQPVFRLSCREAGQFPELIALVGKVGAKGARKRGYLSRLVIGTFDNVFIALLLHGQPHVEHYVH